MGSMKSTNRKCLSPTDTNKAMKVDQKGGIDLTPVNMNLQTNNTGSGIKFKIDPAMLQQLQNAPGLVPVIINIQPMTNLSEFLGLENNSKTSQLSKF